MSLGFLGKTVQKYYYMLFVFSPEYAAPFTASMIDASAQPLPVNTEDGAQSKSVKRKVTNQLEVLRQTYRDMKLINRLVSPKSAKKSHGNKTSSS